MKISLAYLMFLKGNEVDRLKPEDVLRVDLKENTSPNLN